MRMPVDEFFIQAADHFCNIKIPGLGPDLSVKDNVQEKISQFLLYFLRVLSRMASANS